MKKKRIKRKAKTEPWQKTVKATAMAATFEIEVNAGFTSFGLSADEVDKVRRKLIHNLTKAISTLPFAETYPWEVSIR